MPPTVEDRCHDIVEAIAEIEGIWAGKTFADFTANRPLRLATERLLEIVCEASRKLPDTVKRDEPAIAWMAAVAIVIPEIVRNRASAHRRMPMPPGRHELGTTPRAAQFVICFNALTKCRSERLFYSTPPLRMDLSSGVTSMTEACPVIFTGGRQSFMQGLEFQNAFSAASRSSS